MKKYGDIERITFYRALRFIDSYNFEFEGIDKQIPVNLIYQPRGRDLPPDTPKNTIVWDSWELGVESIPFMAQQIKNNNPVDVQLLKNIHTGFYQISDTIDAGKHSSYPGTLRNIHSEDMPIIKDMIWETTEEHLKHYPDAKPTKDINSNLEFLKDAQLLPQQNFDYLRKNNFIKLGTENTTSGAVDGLLWVMKADSDYIYVTHHAYVELHMKKWVAFFNHYTQIINSNYSMGFPAHYPLFTPLEFASFMQKWMVEVHPFNDGNGRNSRYWYDAIVYTYKLPFAPAGWIQNDMMMSYNGYSQNVYEFTKKYLKRLEYCVDLHKNKNLNKADKRSQYECALM